MLDSEIPPAYLCSPEGLLQQVHDLFDYLRFGFVIDLLAVNS